MGLFTKLDKLMATEIIALTVVLTTGISSILMMAKVLTFSSFLFSAPDILMSFLVLFLYTLPTVVKFTLPISLVLASAITAMRMSSDREMEAWMSCGTTILRLCRVPFAIGVMSTILCLFSALYFEPYTNRMFTHFKWLEGHRLVESFINNGLREKSFIYNLKEFSSTPTFGNNDISIYFDKISPDKKNMSDVFIAFSDEKKFYSSIIVAKSAQLSKEQGSITPDYVFKLSDGFIYSYQPEGKEKVSPLNQAKHPGIQTSEITKTFPPFPNWTVTHFSKLNLSMVSLFKDRFQIEPDVADSRYRLYPKQYFEKLKRDTKETPNWQHNEDIVTYYFFLLRQISIPISSLFFPIMGICLGILDPRKKQTSVYLAVLVIFCLWQGSMSLSKSLIMSYRVHPIFNLYFPTAFMFSISVLFLWWRSQFPPSCSFGEFLKTIFFKLKSYLPFHHSREKL